MPRTIDIHRSPADITGRKWREQAQAEEKRRKQEQYVANYNVYAEVLIPAVEAHLSALRDFWQVNADVSMDGPSLEAVFDTMTDLIMAKERISKQEDENAPLDVTDAMRPAGYGVTR